VTAQDAMKKLVSDELHPTFKARGFKKKALTFYRRDGDNFALVQLEKSRTSTAASVDFAINLGIFSRRVQQGLARVMKLPKVGSVPSEAECHLRRRIGSLKPERLGKWWTVRADTDRSELGAKLRSVLETHVFPFLDARATDEDLRDHWMAAVDRAREGLALAVLLRDLGPREELGPLLERLRMRTPPDAKDVIAAVEKFATKL